MRALLGILKAPGTTPLAVPAKCCCDSFMEFSKLNLTRNTQKPIHYGVGSVVQSDFDEVTFSRGRSRRRGGWRRRGCGRHLRCAPLTEKDLPLSA